MDGKKGGKIPAILPETQAAMKEMRAAGKTIKEIADFYHVSQNSVLKYTGESSNTSLAEEKKLELGIDNTALESVLAEHSKRVVKRAKNMDADIVAAGEAIQTFLAEKGIDVDLKELPPLQLLKLIRSPGIGDNMNPELKALYEDWLKNQLSKGDKSQSKTSSIEDMKEVLFMKFLMKAIGEEEHDGSARWDQILQEMRSENAKLREEMRDILLEKRLQNMEDKQADVFNNVSSQLENVNKNIADLKTLPDPSLAQKTALGELTEAASQLNKVKSSLIQLGLVQAAPGAVTQSPDLEGIEAFRNADGSLNTIALGLVKGADAVKTFIEAQTKKTPEQGTFVETPAPEKPELPPTPEQYAEYLLSKPSLSAQEQQWLKEYKEKLMKQKNDQEYVRLISRPVTELAPEDLVFIKQYEGTVYEALKTKPDLTINELNFKQRYEASLKPPVSAEKNDLAAKVDETPEQAVVASPIEAEQPAQPSLLDKLKADEDLRNKALEGIF